MWEGEEIVCSNCGVIPPAEDPQPTQPSEPVQQAQEQTDEILTLNAVFRELQFVRYRQVVNGETDSVLLKRHQLEIINMMEMYLENAKSQAVTLNPQASLRARFAMLNAIVLGLGYMTMHPNPANHE